jgi:segregation and condensation protein A
MAIKVKINVFEGPFDLLLHLVRINEMDIYDIPIAEITQQYLAYVSEMKQLDLEVAGDYLVMAATLLQIKARALMPIQGQQEEEPEQEQETEEEGGIRDARDLMRRLIEYRQFKEMAVELSDREENQLKIFYRDHVASVITDKKTSPEAREDINLLFSAFARVLDYTEKRPVHRVLEEEFSVEEKIEIIKEELERKQRVNVQEMFNRCINKMEVITVFLAMLEVCRQKVARVYQPKNYQDIFLTVAGLNPEEDDDDFFERL